MTDGRRLPEDRPDPADHAPHLRARVPDQIADGAFSTGAIVVTGPNEFIIDFLQTIGRPHRVAARVIIAHAVMPQFIDALGKNLGLYRDRFGDPPQVPGAAGPATAIGATGVPRAPGGPNSPANPGGPGNPAGPRNPLGPLAPSSAAAASTSDILAGASLPQTPSPTAGTGEAAPRPGHAPLPPGPPPPPAPGSPPAPGAPPVRRPTPQEIYDDLKIPDSVLSGAYANGVMIGHGASEFVLDFLTSFYPQSAVSARVFLAAGQVPRLLDSLHHAMRQLHQQRKPHAGGPPPQSPPPQQSPPPPRPDSPDSTPGEDLA